MPLERRRHTSTVYIKVNGADLPDEQMRRVVEVVVDQSLHVPDMFTIRLLDLGDDANQRRASFFKMLDQDVFAVGAEVQIDMGRESEAKTVIKGEITSNELEVGQDTGPILTVRGYARSHRLHRGRQSRSFLSMSDGDIVQKVAQEAGLTASCDSSSTHDYVFQNNQTNWEFLKERAFHLGYELFVEDRTLHFRKPQNGQNPAPEQKLWENLLSLRVKVSSVSQADEVIVKGWDYKAKQAIVGRASRGQLEPKTGIPKTGAEMASDFGKAKVYVVDHPVESQAEADTLARAIYDELDGTFVEAEGVCLGDPAIKPGTTVKMSQLGTRLSGQYYITSATHRKGAREDYRTAFTVSGRHTNSLLEVMQGRRAGAAELGGVVVGIVTNNSDPDNLGRVKVKFPWLVEDESWWARVAAPGAGRNKGKLGRGVYFVPEVDDEVLVAFEHGDVHRPYVIGALWNGKDTPPYDTNDAVKGGKVVIRLIGDDLFGIGLDSTEGDEQLVMGDKGPLRFAMHESDKSILIKADGPVSIEAGGDVSVSAGGKAVVKAQGDVQVEAQANANVKANGNASVEATGTLDLKGATVNVKAQGTMSVEASGPLTIKGAVVNIN